MKRTINLAASLLFSTTAPTLSRESQDASSVCWWLTDNGDRMAEVKGTIRKIESKGLYKDKYDTEQAFQAHAHKTMEELFPGAGCSEHEVAAVTGHRSLQEVRRYTAAAQQVILARRAMGTIPSPNGEQNLANPAERLAKMRPK